MTYSSHPAASCPIAAVVRLGAHLGRVIFVDQATIDEGAQNTGSHAGLHVGKCRRVESVGKGGMKGDARRIIRGDGRLEHSFDDATVEMDIPVQASAEILDEGDRSIRAVTGQAGYRRAGRLSR